MKKLTLFPIFLLFFCFYSTAQVTVSGSSAGNGTYSTLSAAMTAIGTTSTGTIIISITADVTETATITIGAGAWTSLTISPSGGASRTISGAITAGSPLIDFSGADNVTIDGLNSGGNAMTISNTTASATSGTSTIRFISGATSNTITKCTILGSFSAAVGTNGGNIFFSTDGSTSNGNDNNTISSCNIGPAGSNLPTKCIYGNGSTTTTAIGNSGITITNNNIYDYFGAAVTSAGVYTAGGCNTWTVTNNKFYQTGTRTWTTGAQNSAIWLLGSTATSGMQGVTVTGNTIGYSSSSGTGTYTLTGNTGKFVGIYFTAITGGTTSDISSNTISSVSLTGVSSSGTSTSSAFSGIIVTNGVATTNSNTIGSMSSTGSLTYNSTATTATDIYGIYNFSSNNWTSSNNNIGGITATFSGTTTALIIYGLRANTTSSVTWTVTGNTIGGTVANSIQNNSTSTGAQVIGMLATSPGSTITTNTIRNLTAAGGTGTTTAASVIGISIAAASANHTVSQNTIHTLSNTSAAGAVSICGIQYNASTGTNVVSRNFIHSFSASSTNSIMNGINVSGGTTTYHNNMIRLGVDASGNSITTACLISGISEPLGTDNFYFNTVYIGGTGVGSTVINSYAFNSQQTTNARNFKNNIFYNERSNSSTGGKHYAVRVGGTTANPTGLSINNNEYYAGGTGGTFGYFNSADVASLTAWRTAVGQDANSCNSSLTFTNANGTSATVDLSINMGSTPTSIESGALTGTGITDEYSTAGVRTGYPIGGQVNGGGAAPDIGADEFDGAPLDLSGPSITYTTLTNSSATTTRNVTGFSITDASNVNTTASTKPRLYYKKSGNTNTYNDNTVGTDGWKYVEATGSSSPFDFTIDYSLISGGVGATDVIQYFVVAQDLASTPNVSINAGTFTSSPTSVDLTSAAFPITSSINSFTIVGSISGAIDVGATGTYATLTAALSDIGGKDITGAITLNLKSDYNSGSETFPITIPSTLSGISATNTLTIKPASGVTASISGSSTSAIIVLNGADYITIDGSNNGSASRDLTISNTNTGTSSAMVWLQTTSGSDAATNNTVKNCNLTGSGVTQTLFGVGSGSTSIATTSLGTGNNNNTYNNNNISGVQYGIYTQGASSGNKNSGTTISQNQINTSANTKGGIWTGFENNITITQNNISSIALSASPDVFGITCGFGTTMSATTSSGNEVTNATITKNVIGGVVNTGTFSAYGIGVSASTSGTTLIANNIIYGVAANGTSGDFSAGIVLGGGSGSTTNIYYNTVSMQGNISGSTAASQTSACLAVTNSSAPTIDLRNNILSNTQAGNTSATLRFASIALAYSSYTALTTNYNDMYCSGAGPGTYQVGITGTVVAGTNSTALSDWQTTTSKDANSVSGNPSFTSTTNLQPQIGSLVIGAGIVVSGVTTDYAGNTRSGSTPSIGAYENGVDLLSPTIGYTNITNQSSTSNLVLTGFATITDASGVNTTAGTKPRLYYKKSANANTYNDNTSATDGWKYVEASNASSPFDFTIDYSKIYGGSVSTGTIIQYFTIAQDNASSPNTGIYNATFGSTPSSVALATANLPVAGTTSSYIITGSLSGTYNIGTGGDYLNFTGTDGFFAVVNASTVGGNITASVISDVTETGSTALNQWTGSNTLTIQPDAATIRTISGTAVATSTPMININGADNVTIDGRFSGAGQYLRFRNTNATPANTGPSVQFTNGSTGSTIRNAIIENNGTTTSGGAINIGNTGTNSVTIQNNDVRDAVAGTTGSPAYAIHSAATTNTLTVSDNNIYDFSSRGISLASVADACTISGNSIYAATAKTTALTGILVSSGNNHSITNNYIGGSTASCGGTALTNSGAVAVTGISLSVGTGTATSVQNNTIQNIALSNSGASSFSGIMVSAGVVNIGTSTGNTIGHASSSNSISVAGSSTTTGVNSTTSSTISISNNTVANITASGTGTGVSLCGIIHSGTGIPTIQSNTIKSLASASTSTGTISVPALTGVLLSASGNASILQNTIYSLSLTGSGAVSNSATGIIVSGTTSPLISKNTIYNITNASTGTTASAPPQVIGMLFGSITTDLIATNNMIALGIGATTNTAFIGINNNITSSGTIKLYYNTIDIEGTVGSGALLSAAFMRGNNSGTAVTSTVDIKNNIFNNSRSGGTGKHYAIANQSTSVSTTGWSGTASDINSLNSGSSSTIGLWGSTDQTFTNWKTNTGGDNGSFGSTNVTFTNSSTGDLHLNMGVTPTVLESGGSVIAGISTDYDNDARPGPSGSSNGGATAPDIGADEFDGVIQDVSAPNISYSALTGTTSTSDRTLSVSVSDATGVPTTGSLVPRIYYNKNNGSWYSQSGILTSGSGTNGTWDFSIVVADMGGVTALDVVKYFIVAQDIAGSPNIGSSPAAGLVATDVNTITTAPTTPNSYMILGSSYNVGSGQTYTTLGGAGGFFEFVNTNGLGTNTTVNIKSDITETGAVALTNAGMNGYTLTIQSDGTAWVLSGTYTSGLTSGLIDINGASGVTIDGGAGKLLTIRNSSGATPTATLPAIIFRGGITSGTIQNCYVESNNSSATSGSIVIGTGTNTGIVIKSNDIRGASNSTSNIPANAIYLGNSSVSSITIGGSSSTDGNNIYNFTTAGVNFGIIGNSATVRYNNIYQAAARTAAITCVLLGSGSNHVVSNNNLYQATGNLSGFTGISIIGSGNGHTVSNNSIGGSDTGRTSIMNITSGFGANGINLTAGTAANTSVQGNTIANIGTLATTSASANVINGIIVNGGNVDIGTTTGNNIGTSSQPINTGYDNGAINIASGAGTVTISNNTIRNINYNLTTPSGDRVAGIFVAGGTVTISGNIIQDVAGNGTSTSSFNPSGITATGGTLSISGNTIFNISNTNSGGAAYRAAGIYISASGSNTIDKNRIYNISASGTGTTTSAPQVWGIYLASGAGASTVSNNQISISGSTNQPRIRGIEFAATTNCNYFYNTIYIGGTAAAANSTYGIYRNSTSGTIAIKNNLLYNERAGTGTHFPIGTASTTSIGTVTFSNNILIGASSANMGDYAGTVNTFTTWNTNTSQTNSYSDVSATYPSAAIFTSTSSGNLASALCLASNSGTVVTTATDYTGASRDGSTPDIGSVEFATGSVTLNNAAALSTTGAYGQVTVSWTAPVGCASEVMIVVKPGSSVSGAPTGNGSSYTANTVFGTGGATSFDATGYVVYKGSTSPQVITGLNANTTYYVKVFTRYNSIWSSGTEANATTYVTPTTTEVFVPQYMQGTSGTNTNRIPHAFRLTLSNLQVNTTYRYFNGAVTSGDVSASNGAGNPIIVNASGSTFTRVTSPDLSNSSNYGTLTSDGSGNYTGWFMLEPTADTRFATGNALYMRIMLNDGTNGTSVATRITTTNPAAVIDLSTGNTANDGTAIRGSSYTSDKNFAVLYDNPDGSGGSSRPIAATVVENDAVDNSTSNGYASFYNSNVNAVSKQWGTIIPNVNANGIKRVEYRNLTDGSMNYWFSDVDGNWNGTANTVNPGSGATEIVIPYNYTDSCTFRTNTTISGDQTIGGNNNIADGVIVTISPGATLTINGKVSGTGTGVFRGSNTSSILIGGTGANGGILRMDQTTTGSTNRLQNLTLNRGTSPSNGGVDLGNILELTGTLTLSNGTLTTGGNLTLVSNGSGTARVATIPVSADISGNVSSQRFVPAVARRYRMFSPNTSSFTFSDLVDDMFISGPGGATNGFDPTPSNSNTAYTYQESTSGGRGWKGVPSISTSLSAGLGALVFVRGDRTLASPDWYTTGLFPSQNAANVDFNGQLNKGTISPSITFTSTTDTSADGWNLVGNPYASQIDWSTVTKSGLDGNFWTLDPSTGSYYGNNTGVIASGQAFFVHAISASPAITFNESDKVSGAPANFFKTANPKIIARMIKDSITSDLTELEFVPGTSKSYIPSEDIIKMYNSSMNFGITSSNNFDVQKNAIPPILTVSDTVRLFAFAPAGQYTLNFSGASSLSSSYSIYLMDMFTSTTQDLRTNPNYTFNITSNSASSGYNRFRLIFVNPSALPVKLVDFYAEKGVNRSSVQLHWRTSSENNSSRFVIERSADNTTEFNEIGVVGAKGNSTSEIGYQFDDIDILKANHDIIYYRLKQIDKDGSSQQSQIVSVRTVNPPTETLVYPNPATSIISIRPASEIKGNVHVDIYDIVGKLNVSKDIFVTTGQEMMMDVSILETGVYIIRYSLLNSGAQNFIKFEKK